MVRSCCIQLTNQLIQPLLVVFSLISLLAVDCSTIYIPRRYLWHCFYLNAHFFQPLVKNSPTTQRQYVEIISSSSSCLCRLSGSLKQKKSYIHANSKLEFSENLLPGRSFQVHRGNVLGLRPSSGSSRRSGHKLKSVGQIKFSPHHKCCWSFLTRLQASFKTLLRLKNFLIIKHFKVTF